jgi:hypothetical protein
MDETGKLAAGLAAAIILVFGLFAFTKCATEVSHKGQMNLR